MSETDKLQILVVDDDNMIRQVLRLMLNSERLHVAAEAPTAARALDAAERCKPDIALLDIVLPDREGIELIPELLALREDMKIIMMTSDATKERVQKAIELGAKGFIAKPLNGTAVLRAILQAI